MADNLPPSSVDVTESGSLKLPEPTGPHRPVMGLLYILPFYSSTDNKLRHLKSIQTWSQRQARLLLSVIMKTVRYKVSILWCLRARKLWRGFQENASFRSDSVVVFRDTMRGTSVFVNHNRKVEYNNYSKNKKCELKKN
jgi:hypothetical protein